MENKHHIFVELKDGKVRDAKMITLDELRAEGWERDAKERYGDVSSAWVQDVATGEKLRNEPCEVWLLADKIAAHVSVAAYPSSKRIKPLFGFTESATPQ